MARDPSVVFHKTSHPLAYFANLHHRLIVRLSRIDLSQTVNPASVAGINSLPVEEINLGHPFSQALSVDPLLKRTETNMSKESDISWPEPSKGSPKAIVVTNPRAIGHRREPECHVESSPRLVRHNHLNNVQFLLPLPRHNSPRGGYSDDTNYKIHCHGLGNNRRQVSRVRDRSEISKTTWKRELMVRFILAIGCFNRDGGAVCV